MASHSGHPPEGLAALAARIAAAVSPAEEGDTLARRASGTD